MKNKLKGLIILIVGFVLGMFVSGYLLVDIQPRSFLAVKKCDKCWRTNEILGLMIAADITKDLKLIPDVVHETDRVVVVKHPIPRSRVHYVLFPKKDIKDIADVTDAEQQYISDIVSLIGDIVREEQLDNYRVISNGPGYQTVRYLHFHLLSR